MAKDRWATQPTMWQRRLLVIILVAVTFAVGYRFSQALFTQSANEILHVRLIEYASVEGLDPTQFVVRSIRRKPSVMIFDVVHPGPPRHLLMVEVGWDRVVEFHRMIE